jgi:hypothetical protein
MRRNIRLGPNLESDMEELTRLSNGLSRVSQKHAPDYGLDVYVAHKENNSPVKLYPYYDSQPGNDSTDQRWVLMHRT